MAARTGLPLLPHAEPSVQVGFLPEGQVRATQPKVRVGRSSDHSGNCHGHGHGHGFDDCSRYVLLARSDVDLSIIVSTHGDQNRIAGCAQLEFRGLRHFTVQVGSGEDLAPTRLDDPTFDDEALAGSRGQAAH